VIVKHTELGEGTLTGISTIVAEEMDADWSQVRAVEAPSDPALYKKPGVRHPGHRRIVGDRQLL